ARGTRTRPGGDLVSDDFLDDQGTRTLAGDLAVIAAASAELLRIARRETSPPGGRSARNPHGYDSRPPLSLGALSGAHEMHTCLAGWADNLRDDTSIQLPIIRDDQGLASHLRYHVHRIAMRPWGKDCAVEIARWSSIVQTVTTPPPDKYLADYTPAQRREGMTRAKVDAPTCAELVAEWTKGALRPTPDQIRTWGKRGHVARFGPKGHGIYSPLEVIAHMRTQKKRREAS
ncbi:MAG: hypothetical protein Q4G40_11985, partial [Brachybacterium sp.]|nr:hypothetical protein [Brachybacterium sp.]